ncbi:MAG: hypothetical protein WKF84_05925 [Pyrinomonadaceae bacterium]
MVNDDHQIVRQGLVALVNMPRPGMTVVAEAADGQRATELLPSASARYYAHGLAAANLKRRRGDYRDSPRTCTGAHYCAGRLTTATKISLSRVAGLAHKAAY